MNARSKNAESAAPLVFDGTRWIIVGGLAVGVVLGSAGNFVEAGNVKSILYAISAVGLITALVLLAAEHLSAGQRFTAAGFALVALGETRVLNPTETPGGEDSFAVGVLLYAPGLLMLARSIWLPLWVRVIGAAAAAVFAAYSLVYLGGGAIDNRGPFVGIGYALFTLTVLGWIIAVVGTEKTDRRKG
ncbi:hypothetical protein [Arthrobacter sp. ISL-30]|uniref:hypothetical protein n=1 Tax=Arthrobacter sp. ISL-30 TaxID=2819109 RepID=UPI001BEA4B65|nr:hypothetical protein [Arthrobacter sp. ISL-30]MBT2512807.1 hypothetical protein [Arthrobacter sp. ISL-30]